MEMLALFLSIIMISSVSYAAQPENLLKRHEIPFVDKTLQINNTRSKKHVPLDDYITLIHGKVTSSVKKEAQDPYPSYLDPSVMILNADT